MRAVLIVNPNATSTTPAGRDLLAHALESRVKLTVAHTDHRGHAIEIARDAAREGVDVLIVHGGDGTVNEVVNGILGEAGPAGRAPAVGVVPARVWAWYPDCASCALVDIEELVRVEDRPAERRQAVTVDQGDGDGAFGVGRFAAEGEGEGQCHLGACVCAVVALQPLRERR